MSRKTGYANVLTRDDVMRMAMEIGSPELWAFIQMHEHGQCSWEEAMQGAAIHLAQAVMVLRAGVVERRMRLMPPVTAHVTDLSPELLRQLIKKADND